MNSHMRGIKLRNKIILPNAASKVVAKERLLKQDYGIHHGSKLDKLKIFPFYADIIVDYLRRTPSPSRVFSYNKVNSIIRSIDNKHVRSVSNRSGNTLSYKPLNSLKIQLRPKIKEPLRLAMTYKKVNKSNIQLNDTKYEHPKKLLDFGCQISIE